MKYLIIILAIAFCSCGKDKSDNTSSHAMSAYVNGVQWYSDSITILNGTTPNSIAGFTGISGTTQIGLTLKTIMPFEKGSYNFRPAGVPGAVFGSFLILTDSLENAAIEWSTLSETNLKYFSIERSFDGVNFSVIHTINATGNSSITQNYEYTDAVSSNGISYYRIEAIDENGGLSFSNIQVFSIENLIRAFYTSGGNGNGTINVISNDTTKHIVTGTFSLFDYVDYQNKSYQIRNGQFNVHY